MPKTLVITEEAKLAALMDKGKAIEFFFESGDFSIGDVYCGRVENILPSIDAVFVNLGHGNKMGFLHANSIKGYGPLDKRIFPKQKILVQIIKEPTANKGPRISTDITLTGRFFVLTTENENIILSRKINNPDERARLKAIVSLLKPPIGFGIIIRTEAEGASEAELEADFKELFLNRWKRIIDEFENQKKPCILMKDAEDLSYKILRDVFHEGIDTIAVDNEKIREKCKYYLDLWAKNKQIKIEVMPSNELLERFHVMKELKNSLLPKVNLPNGGYLLIEPTEAMTVVDVNSGKFTSSSRPEETVLLTNIEAATEIARQLRIRNIGGVIVIDFIDMPDKHHRIKLLEHFEKLLEQDLARPQIGRLSDLGLVEITRHRQERSLYEALGRICDKCSGNGYIFPLFEKFDNREIIINEKKEEKIEIIKSNENTIETGSIAELENKLIDFNNTNIIEKQEEIIQEKFEQTPKQEKKQQEQQILPEIKTETKIEIKQQEKKEEEQKEKFKEENKNLEKKVDIIKEEKLPSNIEIPVFEELKSQEGKPGVYKI